MGNGYAVRKFNWWRHCFALWDEMFNHVPSTVFDETLRHIELCTIASSVTYSEIRRKGFLQWTGRWLLGGQAIWLAQSGRSNLSICTFQICERNVVALRSYPRTFEKLSVLSKNKSWRHRFCGRHLMTAAKQTWSLIRNLRFSINTLSFKSKDTSSGNAIYSLRIWIRINAQFSARLICQIYINLSF